MPATQARNSARQQIGGAYRQVRVNMLDSVNFPLRPPAFSMRLLRLLKIASVASRFGLDEMVLEHEPSGRLVRLANALQFWRDLSTPRAVRLRLALEALGPIFVKFGQVLSTRRDLMPTDIAD